MTEADDGSQQLDKFFTNSFESKLLDQLPEDESQLTPSTRLLSKKQEMNDLEIDLITLKERFAQRMERLGHRKEELRENEAKLQKSLKDYDKYLKENDLRRKRALKKTKEEMEECQRKDTLILQLKSQINTLRELCDDQKKRLANEEIYETFLKSVLDKTHEFQGINELIDRHATLSSTNAELVQQHQENRTKLDNLNLKQDRAREHHSLEMLRLNNTLSKLETELETVIEEREYWEKMSKQAEDNASKRTLLLGRIRMATANLYALVDKRSHGQSQNRVADTERQLEKVKIYIQDQQEVYGEYERALLDAEDDQDNSNGA